MKVDLAEGGCEGVFDWRVHGCGNHEQRDLKEEPGNELVCTAVRMLEAMWCGEMTP